MKPIFTLVGFLAACAAVSVVGGTVTATSVGTWYQGLSKPGFNPPDWLFGPVWTVLYVFIAVAGWRVWRRGGFSAGRWVPVLYWGQLGLNLLWSFLFFGARAPGAALAEIVVLLAAIAATTVAFWRRDRAASVLFMPYLAWVAFATVLNFSIWQLNG